MRDRKLTERLGKWLDAEPGKRDLKEGAVMLMQLSGNPYMAKTVGRFPERYEKYIAERLKQYHEFRLREVTHEQVREMAAKVETIVSNHSLDAVPGKKKDEERFTGKRPDHDSLPEEVRYLYKINLPLRNKMRELHTALTLTVKEQHTCLDSEMYPYLVELIKLDKEYNANWKIYDKWKPGDKLPEVPYTADTGETLSVKIMEAPKKKRAPRKKRKEE